WQSAIRRERSAYPLHAGRAQESRGASAATRALARDGRSLPHGRTARWRGDQLCTSRRPLVPSVLPPYSDERGALAGSQRSPETALPIPVQSVGGSVASCFLGGIARQHPE